MASTCREEILAIWPTLEARSADGAVTVQDVVAALAAQGSKYAEATIRTHVVSRMRGGANSHHDRVYDDLERVAHGRYRLLPPSAGARPMEMPPVGQRCLCGCGSATSGGRVLYRPGHDARHASQVAQSIRSAPGEREQLLGALPSVALRAKAQAMASGNGAPAGPTEVEPQGQLTPVSVANEESLDEVPAGDSSVQREAEAVMLAALASRLFVPLAPERIYLSDGSWVEVDGVGQNPPVLVEAWAHQGPPKSAQRNKVLADALKLVHVAKALGEVHRKVLCFSDPAAAAPFTGRSWYAGALRALQVECHVVTLDDGWRQRILQAQRRQYR